MLACGQLWREQTIICQARSLLFVCANCLLVIKSFGTANNLHRRSEHGRLVGFKYETDVITLRVVFIVTVSRAHSTPFDQVEQPAINVHRGRPLVPCVFAARVSMIDSKGIGTVSFFGSGGVRPVFLK